MKRLLSIALLAANLGNVACSSSQQAQSKVQRKPLEKQRREYKSPKTYDHRELGYDPKTGKVLTYDHKPRVELIDDKAGKYAFKWIGYDGKEKVVVFQRGDVLDVVVTASVSKTTDKQYAYTYTVENLSTSATYLKRFRVQNFAEDVIPDTGGPFVAYTTSNSIHQFREGNWLGFADASDDVQINPGQKVQIRLRSFAPPGLVECRASIETVMEGGGEHMPTALENLLPGYEELPRGYTIGPVDNLKTLSSAERIKYLLEKLPTFRKAGWMTDQTFSRYEQFLKRNRLDSILGQIDQDLKAEQITTEVFAIIHAMK
jgi:hypothetical protein